MLCGFPDFKIYFISFTLASVNEVEQLEDSWNASGLYHKQTHALRGVACPGDLLEVPVDMKV